MFLIEDYLNFPVQVEAALIISNDTVVLSQNKVKLNVSFGPVARKNAHTKLCAEIPRIIHIDICDGKRNVTPRIMKNFNDMLDNGRTCRKRDILKLEQYFLQMREKKSLINQPRPTCLQ